VPDEPILDESIVDGLRHLGDDVLADILRLWFENLDPSLDAMRSALAGGDARALSVAAHTLRGSAANVGAARLAAACATLEVAAKQPADAAVLGGLLATVESDAGIARSVMSKLGDGPA